MQGASHFKTPQPNKSAMKDAFKQLARKNGSLAKQKAQRVTALLQEQQSAPLSDDWSQARIQARELSRAVEYHLRQASLIGNTIRSLESREEGWAFNEKRFGPLIRIHVP